MKCSIQGRYLRDANIWCKTTRMNLSNLLTSLFIAMVCLPFGKVWSEELPEKLATVIERYCSDCHDEDLKNGDLDLFSLEYDLDDGVNLSLIHI